MPRRRRTSSASMPRRVSQLARIRKSCGSCSLPRISSEAARSRQLGASPSCAPVGTDTLTPNTNAHAQTASRATRSIRFTGRRVATILGSWAAEADLDLRLAGADRAGVQAGEVLVEL